MVSRKQLSTALPIIALGLVFVVMAYWGGAPRQDGLFVVGVLVQLVLVAVWAALVWYLLFSPLPSGAAITPKTSQRSKQILGMLVSICGINFVVGGIWDAIWHLTYGIPFGKDLLWRPHLLLYSSFILTAGFATAGLYLVTRDRQGLRVGFRHHPLLGLLVLVSAFMLAAVGLDPIWHTIYGGDISAWSLPHLILLSGFDAVMIVSAIILASTNVRPDWVSIRRLKFADLFVFLPLTFAAFMTLLLGTIEWADVRAVPANAASPFWGRPEWLFPVLCITVAVFLGTIVLRLTRCLGSATILGLLTLGLDILVRQAAGTLIPISAAWLYLFAMIGLDVAYVVGWRRSKDGAPWYLVGVTSAIAVAFGGLPVIAQTMIYPRINLSSAVGALFMTLVMASSSTWLAQTLLSRLVHVWQPADDQQASTDIGFPRLLPVGLVAVFAALITIFVFTATPPR